MQLFHHLIYGRFDFLDLLLHQLGLREHVSEFHGKGVYDHTYSGNALDSSWTRSARSLPRRPFLALTEEGR